MSWTVKQVVKKTGISADTLRYYDKMRIVSPRRHENGYRYYDETDITNLRYIVVMKYAHFSLDEIKNMVEIFSHEPSPECNEVCKGILHKKINTLKQTISNYREIVRLMEELLPMMDSIDDYLANERRIDEYIYQIFDDICSDATPGSRTGAV
jgi:MerR family Zn(II)-responsive transcriptional regulator of zntA